MENLETSPKPSFLKISFKYGVLIGLGLIAASILFQFVFPDKGRTNLVVSILIMLVGLYLASKTWRDYYKEGYLSYNQALGFGSLTFFFASLVLGFFTFLLYQFLYPQGLENALLEAEKGILETNPNITEQELELALSISRTFINPIVMGLLSTLFYSFLGFLGSLISSALVKREKPYEV